LQANDWWKTLSLFLWLYNALATALVLAYFYGICRLAERNFEGRIYAVLLLPFFLLTYIGMLAFSVSSSVIITSLWFAIWSGLSSVLLIFVVYRAYRVMLG
jgi:hypothetical protein